MAYSGNAVDSKHKLYMRNKDQWETVTDCVDGEAAVKRRGEKYLPHPNPGELLSTEPKVLQSARRRYTGYKARARFINATGRTLNGMLGIAFSKPVVVNVTGGMALLADDADGKGTPLTQLMRDMLAETLKSGRGAIVSDYTGTGEQTSETAGRPLLRFFEAINIINWRVTNNKTTLFVAEYTEEIEDDDGFVNQERTIWLELRMIGNVAHARKWTQNNGGNVWTPMGGSSKTDLIPLRDASGNTMDELPVSWLGSVNNDAYPDPAPLADIASLNIGHYQADADVCESAHIVGQPTLVVSGLTQSWAEKYLKSGVMVGATNGILLNDTGKAEILQAQETNASTNLKEQRTKEMSMLGAKLVERGTSARTATQASSEAETDNSILSLCAGNVEQCLNRALLLMALMVNGTGTVGINKRYEVATIDPQLLTALMGMVQNGMLSLHNFIRYQQSIGLVDDEQQPEAIEGELRDQPPLPGLDLLSLDTAKNTAGTPPAGQQGGE